MLHLHNVRLTNILYWRSSETNHACAHTRAAIYIYVSPDDGEGGQLLQVEREIHTKVRPEQSSDGDCKTRKRGGAIKAINREEQRPF